LNDVLFSTGSITTISSFGEIATGTSCFSGAFTETQVREAIEKSFQIGTLISRQEIKDKLLKKLELK